MMPPESVILCENGVPIKDQDNWSGISNSRDRRKIQNRLNQRAYRKPRRHVRA